MSLESTELRLNGRLLKDGDASGWIRKRDMENRFATASSTAAACGENHCEKRDYPEPTEHTGSAVIGNKLSERIRAGLGVTRTSIGKILFRMAKPRVHRPDNLNEPVPSPRRNVSIALPAAAAAANKLAGAGVEMPSPASPSFPHPFT
jgi:hypothetical protein